MANSKSMTLIAFNKFILVCSAQKKNKRYKHETIKNICFILKLQIGYLKLCSFSEGFYHDNF